MKKINKKGFSLVELLAVAVILGLIAMIVTPIVSKLVEENRQKAYNRQIEGIEESAKVWGSHNLKRLPNIGDESIVVTLGELKRDGYADKDLKDPRTDINFDDDKTKVIISNQNGILIYEVVIEQDDDIYEFED